MADITEALDVLVGVIAGAAYPNGTAATSVANCPVMVYQGWPEPQSLQRDLGSSKAHISVFPRPGGKVTTIMLGDTDWVEVDNNGTTGDGALEVRRQSRTAQITIWGSAPAQRDTLAKAVDSLLARTTRLAMPDGSQAILTTIDEIQIDAQQKSGIYRRDLLYSINYATTYTEAQTAILQTVTTLSGGPSPTAHGPTITLP